MKIIVGLGNPGLRYRNTRHNVGFLVIDKLAEKYKIAVKKKGYSGIYGIGRILDNEVILLKPLTYMNLSGEAVKALCSLKAEKIEDLLVITDDFSLELGALRIRSKGSSGGHNGLRSIIELMGPDFARIRVGIGAPGETRDCADYVLSGFSRAEKKVLSDSLDNAVSCIELWISEGLTKAMNAYN